MKIRTDFVTNSSSSSFVLEICIDLVDGKSLQFEAQGGTGETGIIDYFFCNAVTTVSPKQLGTAKSVQELIQLLKNGVYDDCWEGPDYLFQSQERRLHNPTYFPMMIEEYVHSMEDIQRITIRGDEDNSGCHYHRTYSYNTKTGDYVCQIDGCDFDKDGSSGGDLHFSDEGSAREVDHIPYGGNTINTKAYASQKGKERKQKQREEAASGVVEIVLCDPGTASTLSQQYARSISAAPESLKIKEKNFVHTSCSQEDLIDRFIWSKGGNVRASTVKATHYLIIGNNIDHQTSKISKALELNGEGKEIVAMTEAEFWTLAASYNADEDVLPVKEAPKPKKAKAPTKEKTPPKAGTVAALRKIWSYATLDDGTLNITSYKGTDPHVVIPEKIGKKTVTCLGSFGYAKPSEFISLVIPDTITKLGYRVLNGCNYLANADGFVIRRNILLDYMGDAQDVIIPNGITTISDFAFEGCENLANIVIPDNVTTIGSSAFVGCKKLTSIVLPDSVTTIGDWAFYDCQNLTSIILPDSVTAIGKYTFCQCKRLTSIVLPNGVTTIGKSAFDGCEKLTNIIIPDSVTTIGDWAFSWCNQLTIHGSIGSEAERYAKKHNIPFVAE